MTPTDPSQHTAKPHASHPHSFNRYGSNIEPWYPGRLSVRTITAIRKLINSRTVRLYCITSSWLRDMPYISVTNQPKWASVFAHAVEAGYNNIGLYDASSIASRILWYQLILHWNRNITLLGYKNTRLLRHKVFGPFDDVITEFDCTWVCCLQLVCVANKILQPFVSTFSFKRNFSASPDIIYYKTIIN